MKQVRKIGALFGAYPVIVLGITQSAGVIGGVLGFAARGVRALPASLFSLSMVLGLIGLTAAFFVDSKYIVRTSYKLCIGSCLFSCFVGDLYFVIRYLTKFTERDNITLWIFVWSGLSVFVTGIAVVLEKRRVYPWAIPETTAT
jgi:hypothetical protein